MHVSRKALCVVYAVIGVAALVGTWANNLQIQATGPIDANIQFWSATLASAASRSITVDIMWFGLPVMIWMVQEARRLKMRFVWLYIVFGSLIAISFTVPLFMIQRERTLAKSNTPPGELSLVDMLALSVFGVVA
jgi:hypothetical protein